MNVLPIATMAPRRRFVPIAAVLAGGASFAAIATFALTADIGVAHAEIVERVVAVVGEQPILYSELQERSRPFLVKIYASVPTGQQRVAIGEMQKELLGKLVDERLVAQAAEKLAVAVTTKEVDDSIKLKAADLKVAVSDLLAEAAKQGLSEADYRDEVRRELLFSKMLETRVRSRIRVTEDDARDYYRKIVSQERRAQGFRATTLTLDLPKDGNPVMSARVRALADTIVKQARGGTKLSTIAAEHHESWAEIDVRESENKTPTSFGKPIDENLLRLDAGEVSEPFVVDKVIVIVKVVERAPSQVPAYSEVRDILYGRVREEMINKQVRAWLDELKQGVWIDIRL